MEDQLDVYSQTVLRDDGIQIKKDALETGTYTIINTRTNEYFIFNVERDGDKLIIEILN